MTAMERAKQRRAILTGNQCHREADLSARIVAAIGGRWVYADDPMRPVPDEEIVRRGLGDAPSSMPRVTARAIHNRSPAQLSRIAGPRTGPAKHRSRW